MISMIACVGKNFELGRNQGRCFPDKSHDAFLMEKILGKKVLLGYLTWEAFEKKPIPGCQTYVLTTMPEIQFGVTLIDDLEQFVAEFKDSDEEVFVLGGGDVFEQLLPSAKKIYLTEMKMEDKLADTFFPKFYNPLYWVREEIGSIEEKSAVIEGNYGSAWKKDVGTIVRYTRKPETPRIYRIWTISGLYFDYEAEDEEEAVDLYNSYREAQSMLAANDNIDYVQRLG